METGVLALNHFRIRQLMRGGDRRAAVLHGFLENPEDFLWTILVGNTVVNFVIFSLGLVKLRDWLHGRPVWGGGVCARRVCLLHRLRIGAQDALPALSQPPARCWPRPFRLIHRLLSPLVAVVAWFSRGLLHWTGGKTFTGRLFGSRDELRFVMQESAPNLTTEEKAMINRVLDLPNFRVRHVIVPMANAATVAASTPMSEVLALCRERNLDRIPVLTQKPAGSPASSTWSGSFTPAIWTAPGRRGITCSRRFFCRRNCTWRRPCAGCRTPAARLAVVFSPDHGETGIISLQDMLRVIFGEVNL